MDYPLKLFFLRRFFFSPEKKKRQKQIYALLSLRNRSYSTGTMNTVMSVA